MNKRTYHLQNKEDVYMVRFFVVGLDTDKYMGISYICQFRCYPDLGIGKVACRQISYAYLTCLQILKST